MTAIDEPQSNSPRRWWIAALLAIFGGAAGYLYVGRPARALALLAAGLAFWAGIWFGGSDWLISPIAFAGLAVLVVGISVFVVIDAVRIARNEQTYLLRGYNRWWIYAAVAVFLPLVSSLDEVPGTGLSRSVGSFSIPSASMLPTLHVGDYLIADMRSYSKADPKRGDVVVFRLVRDPSVIYAKRIIGLPGEHIQLRNGQVFINGTAMAQTAAGEFSLEGDAGRPGSTARRQVETLPEGGTFNILDQLPAGAFDNTAVYEIPDDHYFVLGDNRDASSDSRMTSGGIGMVPRNRILGKLQFVFWARDWSRIGMQINSLAEQR